MSNLQIIASPYDSGYRDWRMGAGPAYIVENGLIRSLMEKGYSVTTERISVDSITENASAFAICRALAEQVKAAREADSLPLVLTGNCGNALGTVAALGTKQTGIVWFDAHGEFNTPDTTTSGFLDGMGLANITGRCWRALAATVPDFTPVPDSHIILVGARDLDIQEKFLLAQSGIKLINASQIHSSGISAALATALTQLAQRVEQIYVHLDLDVLDPTEAQANPFPAPAGLTVSQVEEALRLTKSQFRIGAVGLASYAPDYDKDNRALDAAIRLLGEIV